MPSDADSILGPPPDGATISSNPDPVAQAGAARVAQDPYGDVARVPGRNSRVSFTEQFTNENKRAGVPLDQVTGLSAWERIMLSQHRTEEDQMRYLTKQHGEGRVRRATDGTWIVTKPSPTTGQLEDMVVDPVGVDLGDVGSVATDLVIKGGGAFLAAKGAASIPKIGTVIGEGGKAMLDLAGNKLVRGGNVGWLRNLIAGAVGAETAGGIEDAALRIDERAPLEPSEILLQRSKLAAVDTAVGATAALGLSALRFLRNPLSGSIRTEVAVNAAKARQEIMDLHDIDVPLRASHLSGNRSLIKREGFVSEVPGGMEQIAKSDAAIEAKMGELRNVMFGARPAEADAVGQRSVQALHEAIAPVEKSVEDSRNTLAQQALGDIEARMAVESVGERELGMSFTGSAVRNAVVAKNDATLATSKALFNQVRALGGDQPIFDLSNMAKKAAAIEKDLPPSLIAGAGGKANGSPFVPADIQAKLEELAAGTGQSVRLTDLQQMRRRVYDEIAKGEAVPTVDAHYLSKIGGLLTEAIDDGVNSLPSGQLKAALQVANKHYVDQVLPFKQKGIAEMFAREGESGYVGDAVLGSRYKSGPEAVDRWNALKSVIGGDSMEIGLLKRQIFDGILSDSTSATSGMLNAKQFLGKLQDLRSSNPDLFKATFGRQAGSIARAAEFAAATEKDLLPSDKIAQLMSDPNATHELRGHLAEMLGAEQRATETYRNKILAGMKKNDLGLTDIKPGEFVDRFLSDATPNEARQVMTLLRTKDPELAEDVGAATLQNLFRQQRAKGIPISDALEKAGKDKALLEIVGKNKFDDLRRYGMMEKSLTDVSDTAGSFAGGKRLDSILLAPLHFTEDLIREKVTAKILMSDWLRERALRTTTPSKTLNYLLVSSPPFLRSVLSEFGNDQEGYRKAEMFMGSIKRGLDQYTGASTNRASQSKGPVTDATSILGPPP